MDERPGRARLLDEPVIALYPSLVRAFDDLAAAAVLQQLHFRVGGRDALEHEGHYWAPITYAELARQIGIKPEQSRRAVERLEERDVILSVQLEAYNRRKSYRIDYLHPLLADMPDHQGLGPDGVGPQAASTSLQRNRTSEATPLPDDALPSEPKPTRKRTPRDDLFDALVAAFGEASTPSRAKFYGRTVSQLVAANATPEQVAAARAEMRRRGWDKPSPEAMVKHWDDLLRNAAPEENRNPASRRFWEDGR